MTTFANEFGGATAMVEAKGRVLLFGGYGKDRDRLVLGDLVDSTLRAAWTGRARLAGRDDVGTATVIGRDGVLHAFAGGEWYALPVADVVRAATG